MTGVPSRATVQAVRFFAAFFAALAFHFAIGDAMAQVTPVRVGALAPQGAGQSQRDWTPTIEYLSRALPGYSFSLIPLDFEGVEAAAASGGADFILANPLVCINIVARHRMTRIATLREMSADRSTSRLGGVIFTQAGREDIAALGDLKGRSFAAVDENSLGGWLASLDVLLEEGVDPSKSFSRLEFIGKHDAVVLAVRDGRVDAGTARTGVLEHMAAGGLISLKDFKVLTPAGVSPTRADFPFLTSTPLYPGWGMSAAGHVPEELASKVAAALLSMPGGAAPVESLSGAGWSVPLSYLEVEEVMKRRNAGAHRDHGRVGLEQAVRQHADAVVLIGVFVAGLLAVGIRFGRLSRVLEQSRRSLREELAAREKAEAELVEREAYLETILATVQVGIMIVDEDTRAVVDVNPAAQQLIGRPKPEIIGQPCRSFIRPVPGETSPLPAPEPGPGNTERILATPNGNKSILKSAVGVTVKGRRLLLESFVDISARKLAELELKKFRLAVEHSAVAIIITGAGGVIEYVNPAFTAVTGYSSGDAVGSTPRLLKSGAHDEQFYRAMWDDISKGRTWRGEFRNRRKNGELYWEMAVITPVLGPDGAILNYIAVKEDITDKKRLDEMKQDVERIMRHDLKAPLNGVIGLPEVMLDDENLTPEQVEMLRMIRESGLKMLRMIDSSLDLFKIETGRYVYQPRRVNALEIITGVSHDMRSIMESKRLSLAVTLDGRLPGPDEACFLWSEERLLYPMLSNLIGNALEASPPGQTVRVEISTAARFLSISNQGAAPKEIRADFFKKYATFGKLGGTGLGAYSAKRHADVMGYEMTMRASDDEDVTVIAIAFPEERPGARQPAVDTV